MKGILGIKVGMTQLFDKNGVFLPVTVLYVEPNLVIGVKTKEKNGYDALQLAFLNSDPKQLNNPKKGVFKKLGADFKKYVREIRDMTGYEVGKQISISDVFSVNDRVDIRAKTKGHGYTGAIKLWNFKTGPSSHGAGYKHRFQGSIANGRGGSQAQRVFKGKKMAGRYGNEFVTIQNLGVVDIIPEENLLLVHGAVPGPDNCLVVVKESKKTNKLSKKYEINRKKINESTNNKVSVGNNDSVNSVSSSPDVKEIIKEA